jgi:hypothetical protein
MVVVVAGGAVGAGVVALVFGPPLVLESPAGGAVTALDDVVDEPAPPPSPGTVAVGCGLARPRPPSSSPHAAVATVRRRADRRAAVRLGDIT